tara:strand:+ start:586 stop:1290 length:705 start_codon:yes stop_codon:yes gene_type:complete
MGNGNSLDNWNLGFNQSEYDALDEWGQQKYLREQGVAAGQGLVRSAGGMTRAAEGALELKEAGGDAGRRLATQGVAESWRQGIGAAGGAPGGGGQMAMLAQLGSQGGATRAAFEAQQADRMAEANIAVAQARQEEAGAQAMMAQFMAEMGTEGDYKQAQWDATELRRQSLLNNYGSDKAELARAFVYEAQQYEKDHPMYDRWIQEAYAQGADWAVDDELWEPGSPPVVIETGPW